MSEKIKQAANDLLAQIDLYTDCMSNQIDREHLDKYTDALQAALDDSVGKMSFQVQELRPEVLAFALLMEQRLRDKDADKGQSWKSLSIESLVAHAIMKTLELEKASDAFSIDLTAETKTLITQIQLVKKTVDLANICMFIADVAGALETNADEARDA